MAFDWSQFMNSINSGLTSNAGQGGSTTNLGGLSIPNTLLGGGLMLGGSLMDKEPGEVTEARQYLRSMFTSPTAIGDRFASNLPKVGQQFDPFFQQQEKQFLDDYQTRAAAGQPNSLSTAMGGGELAGLRNEMANTLIPRRQAFYGGLGLDFLNSQQAAAGKILDTSKPDPTAAAITNLGAMLAGTSLLGNRTGTQTGGLTGAAGAGVGNVLQQLTSQPGGIGQALTSNPQLVAQLGAALGTSLFFDASQAGAGISGWMATTSHGVGVPIEAISGGAGGAGAAGTGGGLGGFLSSGAGTALGAVGAGTAGYMIGTRLGDYIEQPGSGHTQLSTTLGGAAGGAAAGAAIGSIIPGIGTAIGAVIGAIAGGFGGFGAERRREDAQTAQETSQTDAQRPAALQTAQSLGQSGQQIVAAVTPLRTSAAYTSLAQKAAANPQIVQLMQQTGQALAPVIQETFGTMPTFDATPQGIANFLTVLYTAGSKSGDYINQNAIANPESQAGLLQSKEIGKFDPGQSMLAARSQQIPVAQQALQQFLALTGGA
jgi:uncharacterized membrane protein